MNEVEQVIDAYKEVTGLFVEAGPPPPPPAPPTEEEIPPPMPPEGELGAMPGDVPPGGAPPAPEGGPDAATPVDPVAGEEPTVEPLIAAGEYDLIQKIAKAAVTPWSDKEKKSFKDILTKMKSGEIDPSHSRKTVLEPINNLLASAEGDDPLAREADPSAFPPEEMH